MEPLVDGLLLCPPYVCLALVYGLWYGMAGVMDLTVSSRFAVAGYAGWVVASWSGRYPPLDPAVLALAILAVAVVSVACWWLIAPLTSGAPLADLIGSLGLLYVLQAGLQYGFGAAPRSFASYPVEPGVRVLGVTATPLQWLAAGYATAVTVGVALLLKLSSWGQRLKAVAADPEVAAAVLGIDARRVFRQTVWVSAVLIAPAGVIYAVGHGVSPTTGVDIGLLAFVAAITAGRGRPLGGVLLVTLLVTFRSAAVRWSVAEMLLTATGAVFAAALVRSSGTGRPVAIALGGGGGYALAFLLAEHLPTVRFPSELQDLVPYVAVFLCLCWRPDGLFTARPVRAA